jgi:hypothetical protein
MVKSCGKNRFYDPDIEALIPKMPDKAEHKGSDPSSHLPVNLLLNVEE